MNRRLRIARDGVELGTLPEREARELLEAGFLLPTDDYWTSGMPDWRELSRLEPEPPLKATELIDHALRTASIAKDKLTEGAIAALQKIKSTGAVARDGVSASSRKLLEDFTPHIRNILLSDQFAAVMRTARSAVENDVLMYKTFGAVYDCLPRPVCRFVDEVQFITWCMERRRMLLGVEDTPKAGELT